MKRRADGFRSSVRAAVALVALLWTMALPAAGQREQDFALRFMKQYAAHNDQVSCTTISPAMMEKMMKVATSENQAHVKNVLSHLKSIRVVSSKPGATTDALSRKALQLMNTNTRRYQPLTGEPPKEDGGLWIRSKGKTIVELVMIDTTKGLQIVNLTGNMDRAFLQEIMKM